MGHRRDYRRCAACGELAITRKQRFVGGWFFVRCTNCRQLQRAYPAHGRRPLVLFAIMVTGAAAILGAVLSDYPVSFLLGGVAGCALLYAWECAMTLEAPLEAVTPEEAREFRRNWAITALVTVLAIGSITFAALRF